MDVGPVERRSGNNASRLFPLLTRGAGTTTGAVLVVAIGYFVVAKLSLLLAIEHTNATPVWPPTGIALAAVLALGYRVGPGIFAGALFCQYPRPDRCRLLYSSLHNHQPRRRIG
jgi:hypothetical protein